MVDTDLADAINMATGRGRGGRKQLYVHAGLSANIKDLFHGTPTPVLNPESRALNR
jgi:hypothetical protein